MNSQEPPPSDEEVRRAIQASRTGLQGDAERLAELLLLVAASESVSGEAMYCGFLAELDARAWPGLDRAVRRRLATYQWSRKTPDIRSLRNRGLLGLVLASFDPSGYVRQAAVEVLSRSDDLLAVPALVMRTTDWVPEVSRLASAEVIRRLDPPDSAVLAMVVPLALAVGSRDKAGPFMESLENAAGSLSDTDLQRLLSRGDPGMRRWVYSVAIRTNRLSLSQLVEASTTEPDVPTKILCAGSAIEQALAGQQVGALRPLLLSAVARVRANAILAFGRGGQPKVALEGLLDHSSAVRSAAHWVLRSQSIDPAKYYRTMLAGGVTTPAAVAGLGETGSGADSELLGPLLEHPLTRQRTEAVRALRRIGSATAESVGRLLTDPSPRVTRAVVAALEPKASSLDFEMLKGLTDPGNPEHVRLAAFQLLISRDPWTRVLADLNLVGDDAPAVRNRALRDLHKWVGRDSARIFSLPQGPVAAELERQLGRTESTLVPSMVKRLRFSLGLS
jgi:HEAT repeat protein